MAYEPPHSHFPVIPLHVTVELRADDTTTERHPPDEVHRIAQGILKDIASRVGTSRLGVSVTKRKRIGPAFVVSAATQRGREKKRGAKPVQMALACRNELVSAINTSRRTLRPPQVPVRQTVVEDLWKQYNSPDLFELQFEQDGEKRKISLASRQR
ncbi:unnamed protein product [Vitrella brassicaformis CCMP3155]|uniref:Uncharacterized protein n=1 Tax=Vitrella brassicaformis (strain CCMP3155) TaxID=1169540 RepID=A0A0G4EAT3_VITBC|nr:unnamed protein product [Vitrella brassicaformis CCMP3155]|eukprot:CEL92556.1 unnamed protein product [Vitrella brassicaformis CCMP3155]